MRCSSLFVASLLCISLAGCGGETGVTVSAPPVDAPTPEELQAKELASKKAGGAYDGTFKTDMSEAAAHGQ